MTDLMTALKIWNIIIKWQLCHLLKTTVSQPQTLTFMLVQNIYIFYTAQCIWICCSIMIQKANSYTAFISSCVNLRPVDHILLCISLCYLEVVLSVCMCVHMSLTLFFSTNLFELQAIWLNALFGVEVGLILHEQQANWQTFYFRI